MHIELCVCVCVCRSGALAVCKTLTELEIVNAFRRALGVPYSVLLKHEGAAKVRGWMNNNLAVVLLNDNR